MLCRKFIFISFENFAIVLNQQFLDVDNNNWADEFLDQKKDMESEANNKFYETCASTIEHSEWIQLNGSIVKRERPNQIRTECEEQRTSENMKNFTNECSTRIDGKWK